MEIQRGRRVLLRLPQPGDLAEFRAVVRESADFLRPWEPRPPPGLKPDSPERFQRMLDGNAAGHNLKMLVCRADDGRIMGSFSLNNIVRGVFQSAAIGYWIGGAFARRGYMTEALQLALRQAFLKEKLHRVEANIMPHNKASIALVRRAGFEKEGYSRRYLKIAGRWQDHERWALLKEDWRPRS